VLDYSGAARDKAKVDEAEKRSDCALLNIFTLDAILDYAVNLLPL